MNGLVSVNGKISAPQDAVVPALDRGFLFSDAVFEGLVGFHDKLLDAPRHLARLRDSAEAMGLTVPWSDAELAFEMQARMDQVPGAKKNVRLVVTRGNGLGLGVSAAMKPNKVIYCFETAAASRKAYDEGFALKRLVKPGATRGAAPKTANYQQSILAVQRAEAEGFADILWTNAESEVTESSIANVFLIARQGDLVEIVTPPAASGILLGITRDTLIKLLGRASIPVREQVVFADELARFDEAFLCSTVRGLVPVNRIDRHKLFTLRPNSVYRHIERLFLTWVETELGFRVDWASGRKVST
jgi:branched-subunit amino acid aminotransferase/4-amino-4-deoxychorismate lyase